MEAQYATTIVSEGSKLDINDLGSEVKTLREATKRQLLKIFQSKMENDDQFRHKYDGFNFEELVNNIQDWIDADKESLNGGDEQKYYRDFDLEGSNVDFIPANHPFKTMDELHLIAGMKDDFYQLLAPAVTVYGTMGVNVNYAEKDMLMALDSSMTEEAVTAIMERRSNPDKGGPFPAGDDCEKEFLNFIKPYGVNVQAIENSGVPLICDPEFNFRITSTGTISNVRREITVVTFDIDNLADRYAQMLIDQDQGSGGDDPSTPPPTSTGGQNSKIQVPKGRPTVVYWEEN
jgi:general secretion pathway protein K